MNLEHIRIKTYVQGFLLSILITLGAFALPYLHQRSGHIRFSHAAIIWVIFSLAAVQLLVQLYFFLHIGKEEKPRWNLITLGFAALVVLILAGGSLWIMNNLNYNGMNPQQLDQSIIKDEDVHSN